MNPGSSRWLLLLLLAGWVTFAAADRIIEAEGSAAVRHGDLGRARIEARDNALQEAALQVRADVYGSFAVDGGRIHQSTQIRTRAGVRVLDVLDERLREGVLTLRIRALVEDGTGGCAEPAAAYRKKIATVFFPVIPPKQVQVNDYHGYERGIPAELARRLAATGDFLTRDASDVGLYADPLRAPVIMETTADGRPAVTRLAHERGVQFVVSGVVHDLGVERESGVLGTLWRTSPPVVARRLEIEFFVHDALSGELLARHRFARRAEEGDLLPRYPQAFGTRGFFADGFGAVFDRVLDEETAAIRSLLSCRPAMMRVIEQRDGKLYLDAGADTRIRPGDQLTLYRPDIAAPMFGAAGALSQFCRAKATVQVVEVFPGYSIAEVMTGDSSLSFAPGEYLRAW